MSHNLKKVNTNEPNRDGDISTLSLSNVITVSNPVDGQFLSKAATDWDTSNITVGDVSAGLSIYPFGSYNVGSGYWYDINDLYIIYKSKEYYRETGITYLNASGSYSPISSSSWFQALAIDGPTFDGKTLMLEASIAPASPYTSTLAEAQWVSGFGGSAVPLGPPARLDGQGWADTLYGRFECTGTTSYLSIRLRSITNGTSIRLSGGVRHQQETMIVRVYG
jgi:hypothetical protein